MPPFDSLHVWLYLIHRRQFVVHYTCPGELQSYVGDCCSRRVCSVSREDVSRCSHRSCRTIRYIWQRGVWGRNWIFQRSNNHTRQSKDRLIVALTHFYNAVMQFHPEINNCLSLWRIWRLHFAVGKMACKVCNLAIAGLWDYNCWFSVNTSFSMSALKAWAACINNVNKNVAF